MITSILFLVLFVAIYLLWEAIKETRQELNQGLNALRKRTLELETQLREITALESSAAKDGAQEPTSQEPTVPGPVPEGAPPEVPSKPVWTEQPAAASQLNAPRPALLQSQPAAHSPVEPEPHRPPTPPPPMTQPAARTDAGHQAPAPATAAATAARPPRPTDWEATIGGKWLHKIGITVLVIGISFMLAYAFDAFGAWGKCSIAYFVSLALFAAGTKLEKNETYRIYAWSLLGGAWAAGYFTTYSLHFVDTIGIVQSEWIGLLLLAAYTSAMILYSFRFRSQVVTTLASGIGYVTIALSGIEAFSMTAVLLLSFFLVVTGIRMNWIYIPMLGIIGTYGLHASWEAGLTTTAPWWTVILIGIYWAVFLIPTFSKKLRTGDTQRLGLIGTVFNGLGLVACLGVHFGESTELFFSLVVAGVAYAGLTILVRLWLNDRLLGLVLATLSAGLLFLSVPVYFSGDTLLLLWLFEAEFLLILGVLTEDSYFEDLSLLGLAISSMATLAWAVNGATIAAVAVVHYLNWYFLDHRTAPEHKVERQGVFTVLGYAGGILAAYALMIWFPDSGLAYAWLAFCVALMASGAILPSVHLRVQSMLMALPALLPILDSYQDPDPLTFTLTALGFAAFAYSVAWFCHSLVPTPHKDEYGFLRALGFPATLLLGLLLVKHVSQPWLPVSGLLAAAGLLFIGLRLKSISSRLQSYAALSASFLAFLAYTLDAPRPHDNAAVSWLTAALLIAGFYGISFYLRQQRALLNLHPAERFSVEALSYMGMIATAVFTYRQVPEAWVSVVWVGGAVVSLIGALYTGFPHYARKAYLLLAASTVRAAAFSLLPSFEGSDRVMSVLAYVLLAIIFYGILQWAHLRERRLADDDSLKLDFLGRPFSAIAPAVILMVMTFQESSLGILTVYWAIEGLGLFVAGLVLRGRELRLSGVALLGICILKVVFIDVAAMETLNRIFSFIALGLALIAVSYLYVRFSETIRRYL